MNKIELDLAFARAINRSTSEDVDRIERYRVRVLEQWKTLTPVQKQTLVKILTYGRSLAIPEEVRAITARKLIDKGLCVSFPTGEALTLNQEDPK